MEELPKFIKTVDVKTTQPRGYILGVRVAPPVPPFTHEEEIGILAVNPEALKQKRIEGQAIYLFKSDIPKLIKKLKEVI